MSEHPPLPLAGKTLLIVVAATVVMLCGIAGIAFTSHARTNVDSAVEQENVDIRKLLERSVSVGEEWQAVAESNDRKLGEVIKAARRAIDIADIVLAKTPFQFAQDSTQDAQNIEFTINGQLVFLVGQGAQAALKELQ